ncbi:putative membrane-associated kinase regulator 2 [Nicotiana tabacum]|uniref:Membrane-associated kinase regulator 2 n=1 Tax=Nicotiana tabacum TaxID=4097 RepID=A0A1S4APM8_TOBAC|nr:PREDICTED: probable membrane-associated kinase regulator 2 [Nicotiana tabacum]
MEAFSLLKYWRGGGATGVFSTDSAGANPRTADSTTVITAVSPNSSDSDSDDEGDDGPFFDLEFTTVPEDEAEEVKVEENERCKISSELDESSENEISEGELKFTLSTSSGSSIDDGTDPNVSLSPSDDLFFKGSLVPIEPSSLLLSASEANSKFTSSLLKSATKFRVLMLKLKKPKFTAPSKIEKSEGDGDGFVSATTPKLRRKRVSESEKEEPPNLTQNKFFTVKFKVEEVPIKSLFSRDNSSKGNNNNSGKIEKRHPEEVCSTNNAANSASDEKKFTKDVMQKYLKKVKPLYIRVSKRYGEKLKFSGQLSLPGNAATNKAGRSPPPSAEAKVDAVTDAAPAAEKNQKHGNIPTGLRIVRKHLGKSRSASSAVVAAAPVTSNRRDDSLLQQQDAIQGAILHCKRSFNSSRESESSILSRSASDASHEKSTSLTTDSPTLEEAKAVRN